MHDEQGDGNFICALTHHDHEVLHQHEWQWLVRDEPMEQVRDHGERMVQPKVRHVPKQLLSMMVRMGHRHDQP